MSPHNKGWGYGWVDQRKKGLVSARVMVEVMMSAHLGSWLGSSVRHSNRLTPRVQLHVCKVRDKVRCLGAAAAAELGVTLVRIMMLMSIRVGVY